MLIEDDAPDIDRKVVVVDWGPSPGRAVYALRVHQGLSIADVKELTSSTNVVVAIGGYFDIGPLVDALCRAGAKLKVIPIDSAAPEVPHNRTK